MTVKLEGKTQFSAGDLKGAVTKYTEALALCPLKSIYFSLKQKLA